MASPASPAAVRAGAYCAFAVAGLWAFPPLIYALGGNLMGLTVPVLAAALAANLLALRAFERRPLSDLGLQLNGPALRHLLWGLAGGGGAAAAVLGVPLLFGLAQMKSSPSGESGSFAFVFTLLFLGAAGEEILFRGYGFQAMLAQWGPHQTSLPVGVTFALLHAGNPNASVLGMINTAGFGILFCYAAIHSADLWLPTGLHAGWNLMLPLFGVNLSGITMKVSGWEIEWKAGDLWSGGGYGPEASVFTTGMLVLLFLGLRLVPVKRQDSYLLISSRSPAP